jgi:hypothetical protein
MIKASHIKEHMEVKGSDGKHVGTVLGVEESRVKLASGGMDHYIDITMVDAIKDGSLFLTRLLRRPFARDISQGSGGAMSDTTLGWQIAVEHPGNGATEIYNVAISDERQAMDAVRACVRNANGIVVKVKSQLTRRLCKALKLRPGEVNRGMRHPKITQEWGCKKQPQQPMTGTAVQSATNTSRQ